MTRALFRGSRMKGSKGEDHQWGVFFLAAMPNFVFFFFLVGGVVGVYSRTHHATSSPSVFPMVEFAVGGAKTQLSEGRKEKGERGEEEEEDRNRK